MQEHFDPDLHIASLSGPIDGDISDGTGGMFRDIHGLAGVSATMLNGERIGVDLIKMAAGTAFELHTHPGAHVLVVREGTGWISIDRVTYRLYADDSIYVPAHYAHGVSAALDSGICFLAFGVPHMPISSQQRMTLVQDTANVNGPG